MLQYVLRKLLKFILSERIRQDMGLFSFNYAKAGPGISKDAPKKKGIFLYFELLGRKFFKLCQATMLCTVCSIPYFILMTLFLHMFFGGYISGFITGLYKTEEIAQINVEMLTLLASSTIALLLYVLWGSGPASAGFAYITRCFTREEHSWILTDFFKKLKENFKQSMILVVIDFLAVFLIFNAMIQYRSMFASQNQFIWLLLLYVSVMTFIIYTFMHFHIYQIMVTFECKFIDLLKNALLLALGKAPLNLVLCLISAAIVVVMYFYIRPGFVLFLSFLCVYGLVRFPLEFYSARTVQRIMNNTSKGE